ncbi:hypothetical protein CEXT_761381 [Caerostris extrusa]|uniref:Uncharacterized protein n=1 Tax=Caerostris extrusa TaxID=172846 RepID=A0AAV4TAC8_CAEEX|nr:hypothetical protein CEXT_761381 [Caerostris extrusa]
MPKDRKKEPDALKPTDEANAYSEELAVESKRAINYLQVQRNYKRIRLGVCGCTTRQTNVPWLLNAPPTPARWGVGLVAQTAARHHPSPREYITLDSCTVFIMPVMRKDLWM